MNLRKMLLMIPWNLWTPWILLHMIPLLGRDLFRFMIHYKMLKDMLLVEEPSGKVRSHIDTKDILWLWPLSYKMNHTPLKKKWKNRFGKMLWSKNMNLLWIMMCGNFFWDLEGSLLWLLNGCTRSNMELMGALKNTRQGSWIQVSPRKRENIMMASSHLFPAIPPLDLLFPLLLARDGHFTRWMWRLYLFMTYYRKKYMLSKHKDLNYMTQRLAYENWRRHFLDWNKPPDLGMPILIAISWSLDSQ